MALTAAMMLLSAGFLIYPLGSANAAKFCAQLRGATATGIPTVHFRPWTHAARAWGAWGGGHCYKLR